ncbi:hypothetical protein DFAR_2780003 [Desulfarculales bacterium]
MLINPILDKLRALGLEGMLKALEEQLKTTEAQELGFEERLGLMVDRKALYRENRRLKNRLAKAKLRHDARPEDINYRQRRGMDKSLIMTLASYRWTAEHHNLLISVPTRRRQKLSRLRPGPQGLSGRLLDLLQEGACPSARNDRGPRRGRQLLKDDRRQLQDQPAHLERLGAGKTVMGAEPGYARSPGRPLRQRLHHHHHPSARGPVT